LTSSKQTPVSQDKASCFGDTVNLDSCLFGRVLCERRNSWKRLLAYMEIERKDSTMFLRLFQHKGNEFISWEKKILILPNSGKLAST